MRLEELEREAREREREKDLLAYQVREIEGAALREGEMGDLAVEEGRLAHAERLTELAGAAEGALSAEGAAVDGLHSARAALRDAGSIDPAAAELSQRAEGLAAEAAELASDLRDWREEVRVDPQRLQEVSDRLVALGALERKYGEGERGVLAYLEEARNRLHSLEGTDRELEALAQERAEAEALARELAAKISAGRQRAAPALGSALQAELQDLGMEGASIHVQLASLPEPGPSGNEWAELVLSGGPGQPALPIAKTASGGELSRVMLAARTVMADLDNVPTVVFDEVDAGIGGMAGAAVGRRLGLLATSKQVLVVTHLPQIACFADRHVAVTKESGVAAIRVLEGEERTVEIARMLSGRADSKSAVSHARELLEKASTVRTG